MKNTQPIFNTTTHYRIEVKGRVDVEWLQSFDGLAQIGVDENMPVEGVTVLTMHTDQAGIVGLVRRLHGLGMTILHVQIIPNGGNTTEGEEGG